MTTTERVTVRVRRGSASFIAHAGSVAGYFGFTHARDLAPQERSHNFAKVAALASQNKPPLPTLAHFASASPSHIPPEVRAMAKVPEVGEFGLVIAGSEEPIAEVMLVRTLSTILAEWGVPMARVRLNALGDKDSKVRFARELSGYLRKHYDSLDDACRRTLSSSPTDAYFCQNESCRSVLMQGPRAMNFLSEKSRDHFREVLEHIEELSLPYELDDLLVGDERDSRIAFAVDTEESPFVLGAYGGRFDDTTKKFGGKPVCGASIYFRKGGLGAAAFGHTPRRTAPKVYFIQLGLRAKLSGLAVVDAVRRAGVPMTQSFDARSLAPQIAAAKEARAAHLIIMGAREALDNTVIIRAIDNSTQETVAIKDLPRALRSLR